MKWKVDNTVSCVCWLLNIKSSSGSILHKFGDIHVNCIKTEFGLSVETEIGTIRWTGKTFQVREINKSICEVMRTSQH